MVGVGFPKPGLFSQMCLKWSIEHWTLAFIIYYQPVLKKTHGFREETFTNEGFKVVAALEQRPRMDRYFQLRPLGAGVVGVEGGSERETCWETFRVQTCSPLFWPFLSWLCRRKARLTQLIFLLLADQVEDRSLLEDLIEDLERQNQYPDYQYRWTPLCFGQRRETRSPSILWQQLLALAVTEIQKKHRYCKQI